MVIVPNKFVHIVDFLFYASAVDLIFKLDIDTDTNIHSMHDYNHYMNGFSKYKIDIQPENSFNSYFYLFKYIIITSIFKHK